MKIFIQISMTILLNTFLFSQEYEVIDAINEAVEYHRGFGSSLSISDSVLLIGDPNDDYDIYGEFRKYGAGAVHVYQYDGKAILRQTQKLVASDRDPWDFFGNSVSVSGNYAIIGTEGEHHDEQGHDSIQNAGSAYIFERDENHIWHQVQKIVASDRGSYHWFGCSVSISGNYAVVGSRGAQSVYVYKRDHFGIWNQVQIIKAIDNEYPGSFGNKVQISGGYVIIGDQCVYGSSGAVYIFKLNEAGIWEHVQKLIASDATSDVSFGSSIYLSSDFAAIGASYEKRDADGKNPLIKAGAVYVFKCQPSGEWIEEEKLCPSDRDARDGFGGSLYGVSLGIYENNLIVGVPNDCDNSEGKDSMYHAGSVCLFRRDYTGNWKEVQKIISPNRIPNGNFGESVIISENQIFIGAPGENLVYQLEEKCVPSDENDHENIIENGDFGSCVLSPWQTYVYDPAINKVNAVLADGECRFSGLTVSNNPMAWHIQLLQTFTGEQKSRLEAGATYKLSFDAKAEAESKELYLFFGQNEGNPWTAFVNENIIVGTEIENFSFEFTLNSVLPLMRVLFGFGHDPAGLTIDNVRLVKKAGPVSGISQNELEVMRVFPNPACDLLNIQGANGSTVSLMDMLGTLIFSEVIHDNHAILNLQTIPDGVYLIQLKTDQDSYTQIIFIQPK